MVCCCLFCCRVRFSSSVANPVNADHVQASLLSPSESLSPALSLSSSSSASSSHITHMNTAKPTLSPTHGPIHSHPTVAVESPALPSCVLSLSPVSVSTSTSLAPATTVAEEYLQGCVLYLDSRMVQVLSHVMYTHISLCSSLSRPGGNRDDISTHVCSVVSLPYHPCVYVLYVCICMGICNGGDRPLQISGY